MSIYIYIYILDLRAASKIVMSKRIVIVASTDQLNTPHADIYFHSCDQRWTKSSNLVILKDLFRLMDCEKKINEKIHISIVFFQDLFENQLHFLEKYEMKKL